MRAKVMLTIGSQYPHPVQFQIYRFAEHARPPIRVPYNGHKGWIDPGKSKEIELDLKDGYILFLDERSKDLVGPVAFVNDRSIVLTSTGEVTQPAEPEFTDPLHFDDVNFWNDGSVENLLRIGILKVLGLVPTVGGAIAGLVGLVWSEKTSDVVAQSEQRMQRWVRGQFEIKNREFLRNTLSGLRNILEEYANAAGPTQREQWLSNAITLFGAVKPHFLEGTYTPGTLALVVDLATLHIGILRERYLFSKEIFQDQVVNVAHFGESLRAAIRDYQAFVRDVAIPSELAWREAQIEVNGTAPFTLKDWVTREVHTFRASGDHHLKQGPLTVLIDYYKAMVLGSYRTELQIHAMDPSLLWSRFDPDRADEHPIPLDRIVWVGPAAGLPFQQANEHDFEFGDVHTEPLGTIREVLVRAHNQVEALQVTFEGRKPHLIGDATRGEPRVIKLEEGDFITRVKTWWDWQLHAIQLDFASGKSTGKIGDANRKARFVQTLTFPDHRVSAFQVGKRLHSLTLGFQPLPTFYDRVRSA